MHISVWPSPGRATDEILDLACFADECGWFGFWFADHYMPNTGSEAFEAGDVHECWSILPAVAAVTETVRLGPLVAPTSVHHPALLANRAVTIDHLSNGRMVLGLGAGWQINEHRAYGMDLEAPKIRVDRFEENIQITRSLLDNDQTTFAGSHYTFTDAPCDPKPIQDKLPIVVGTGGARMCRITATHADEWNTWGAPGMAGEARQTWNTACDRVGISPDSKHTSVQALIFMVDDDVRADKIRSGDMGSRSIAGSDSYVIEEINKFKELGFDEIIIPDFTLGDTPEQRRENYERFASNIAPHLN